MRLFLLSLLMFLSLSCFSNEVNEPDVYVWKSKAEPIDYKCVPDTLVGFNWAKGDGKHKLVTFNSSGYEHFFLTHISNVPTKALTYPEESLLTRRTSFENVKYKDLSIPQIVFEENSYFFRKQSEDPNLYRTYFGECKYYDDGEVKNIECTKALRHFELDLDTMRFVISYLGTWHHSNNPPDYAGNSAFLGHGECRKYFR